MLAFAGVVEVSCISNEIRDRIDACVYDKTRQTPEGMEIVTTQSHPAVGVTVKVYLGVNPT